MRAPGMWRALNRQRTTGSDPVAPIHDTNRAESPIVRCSLKNLRFETLDPSRHSPLLARAGEREAGLRADLQSDLADLSSGRCLRVRRATAPVCDGLPRLSIYPPWPHSPAPMPPTTARARADYRALENLKARESGYDRGDRLLDRPEASQMANSGPAPGPHQRDGRYTAKWQAGHSAVTPL